MTDDVARPRRETCARSSGSIATHLPRVHSLVRRMAGGRDADELTQDVFVRVWQKLGDVPRRLRLHAPGCIASR